MTCAAFIEIILSGFVGFFTTLFGAGAGALAAYWFAVTQQANTERNTQYRAATNTMLILVSRFTVLENFRRRSLTKDLKELVPERVTAVLAQYSPDTKLDFPSLSFLADPDDSEFIHALSISEANFFNFVEALSERNIHLRHILGSCEFLEYNPDNGQSVIRAKPVEMDLLIAQNRNLVNLAVVSLDSTHEHFMAFAKIIERRFPGLPVFTPSVIPQEMKKS